MARRHLIVTFLGLVSLAPALAFAEPGDAEIAAGPSCNPAAGDLRPQVPLEVVVDRAVAEQHEDDQIVVLNNRGYGYRMPTPGTAEPAPPPVQPDR